MHYRSHTPAAPLSSFIERFWLCSDAPPHARERILPSGTIELVINLREDEIRTYDSSQPDRCTRYSGAVVSGTYSRFFVIDPFQHASILGVHFKPGGAFPFLGLPADELADAHVDLGWLWGAQAAELRERLCAAATAAARFSLLEQALLSRLIHSPARHGAVPAALGAFGQTGSEVRVREVAERVGLSHRRLIQVFAAEIGMTPKLYCRVRRFQRARALAQTAAPDWASIAVDCGYFDQSHLIRDFLAFSGLSPADYLRRRTGQVLPNHIPLSG
ncbi:MAG TPA: helix-turn-helix domain-containing protein [Thermoanaerobaculia bacterium]|nr:helix-turn-helix domain-containing protein [Thermoanaerobaculia bacterium]